MTSSSSITARMVADAARCRPAGNPCDPVPTAVSGLTIFHASRPAPPVPALFEPRFYVLLQGAKRMRIAGRTLLLEPGACAVSTLGLPFQVEVLEAAPERPYLGVGLALDPAPVADALLALPAETIDASEEQSAQAFASGALTPELADPLARLLALLAEPAAIPTLAPLATRELLYRLARGPMGGALRRMAGNGARFAQVRAAAEWIRAHAEEPIRVEALARRVGMSATSLHRHFRAVTGTSPLAYGRQIRLAAARERIVSGGAGVTEAAFASGYTSASQFSREYKRLFGSPPLRDRPASARRGATQPAAPAP